MTTTRPSTLSNVRLRNPEQIVRLVATKRPTVDRDSVLLAVYLRDAEWSAQMQALTAKPAKRPPTKTTPKTAPSKEDAPCA